ncbi:hypothetical protein EC835_102340 [Providencia alcalifaciens]|jgi:hypothetical protein|uniref:Uncharacterized protein n=1 Tax=Providencia alcalifaciens TaxID=126385 RepID=A0A4R3NPZ5_9GAMM|nr:hypothetical protein EC835_102340 [Providencia alcalifaciens]
MKNQEYVPVVVFYIVSIPDVRKQKNRALIIGAWITISYSHINILLIFS